jgi:hypothetical protein
MEEDQGGGRKERVSKKENASYYFHQQGHLRHQLPHRKEVHDGHQVSLWMPKVCKQKSKEIKRE